MRAIMCASRCCVVQAPCRREAARPAATSSTACWRSGGSRTARSPCRWPGRSQPTAPRPPHRSLPLCRRQSGVPLQTPCPPGPQAISPVRELHAFCRASKSAVRSGGPRLQDTNGQGRLPGGVDSDSGCVLCMGWSALLPRNHTVFDFSIEEQCVPFSQYATGGMRRHIEGSALLSAIAILNSMAS